MRSESRADRLDEKVAEDEEKGTASRGVRDSWVIVIGRAKRDSVSDVKRVNASCSSADAVGVLASVSPRPPRGGSARGKSKRYLIFRTALSIYNNGRWVTWVETWAKGGMIFEEWFRTKVQSASLLDWGQCSRVGVKTCVRSKDIQQVLLDTQESFSY